MPSQKRDFPRQAGLVLVTVSSPSKAVAVVHEGLLGGPLQVEPAGFLPASEQRLLLVEALAGVQLGAWDERIVDWLAGWETGTVTTVASWLRRVRQVR